MSEKDYRDTFNYAYHASVKPNIEGFAVEYLAGRACELAGKYGVSYETAKAAIVTGDDEKLMDAAEKLNEKDVLSARPSHEVLYEVCDILKTEHSAYLQVVAVAEDIIARLSWMANY